jgi:hypothetical protein
MFTKKLEESSNSDYLNVLYRAFFNREPNSVGFSNWLSAIILDSTSRTEVLSGFTSSTEFNTLCQNYDITARNESTNNIESFIIRFYQQCLNREPDTAGLNSLVNSLANGDLDGRGIAESFVFSDEFSSLDISDTEFVAILYRTFFNRDPDKEGYDRWINGMIGGLSRSDVLDGFTSAQEFLN